GVCERVLGSTDQRHSEGQPTNGYALCVANGWDRHRLPAERTGRAAVVQVHSILCRAAAAGRGLKFCCHDEGGREATTATRGKQERQVSSDRCWGAVCLRSGGRHRERDHRRRLPVDEQSRARRRKSRRETVRLAERRRPELRSWAAQHQQDAGAGPAIATEAAHV
ncbi:unnamed protein product, partial [Scytosiphon promiscuus]